MEKFTVKEPALLLATLLRNLRGYKRTTVKNLLKFRAVSVNGKSTTRFDHPLASGDQVSVQHNKEKAAKEELKQELQIIFEDSDIIVIDKPAGLLTIATDKVRTRTAFYKLNEYLKSPHPTLSPKGRGGARSFQVERTSARDGFAGFHGGKVRGKPLFIVHRLDQDASGLLIFAKNLEAKMFLQDHWADFTKRYYAVVHGIPGEKEATIKNYLSENKFLRIYSSPRPGPDSKIAITHYKVIKEKEKKSLLEVKLVTGRKHQIRVHLSGMGHPVIGDDKYGGKFRDHSKVRLALHAFCLEMEHPRSHKKVKFEIPMPPEFNSLLAG